MESPGYFTSGSITAKVGGLDGSCFRMACFPTIRFTGPIGSLSILRLRRGPRLLAMNPCEGSLVTAIPLLIIIITTHTSNESPVAKSISRFLCPFLLVFNLLSFSSLSIVVYFRLQFDFSFSSYFFHMTTDTNNLIVHESRFSYGISPV